MPAGQGVGHFSALLRASAAAACVSVAVVAAMLRWEPEPCDIGLRFQPVGGAVVFHDGTLFAAGGFPTRRPPPRRSVGDPALSPQPRLRPRPSEVISPGPGKAMRIVERAGAGSASESHAVADVHGDRLLGRFVVCRLSIAASVAAGAAAAAAASNPLLSERDGRVSARGDASVSLPRVSGVPPLNLASMSRAPATAPDSLSASARAAPRLGAASLIISSGDDRANFVAVCAPRANLVLYFGGESVVVGREGSLVLDTWLLDTASSKLRVVRIGRC